MPLYPHLKQHLWNTNLGFQFFRSNLQNPFPIKVVRETRGYIPDRTEKPPLSRFKYESQIFGGRTSINDGEERESIRGISATRRTMFVPRSCLEERTEGEESAHVSRRDLCVKCSPK